MSLPRPNSSASRHLSLVPPLSEASQPPLFLTVPPLEADGPYDEPGDGHSSAHPGGAKPAEPTEPAEPSQNLIQSLAVQAYEVVEGLRTVAQLGGAITLSAARQLSIVRSARLNQQAVVPSLAPQSAAPGPTRVTRLSAHIIEGVGVVFTGTRARAVAMRLEWVHQRWRATDLTVL